MKNFDDMTIKELKEQINKQNDELDVPTNIMLDRDGDIIFPNEKQVLCCLEKGENYCISEGCIPKANHAQEFKLVRCKREELKRGDTAVRSDAEKDVLKELYNWCKIINEEEQVYIGFKSDVSISSVHYAYWWKLVRK